MNHAVLLAVCKEISFKMYNFQKGIAESVLRVNF